MNQSFMKEPEAVNKKILVITSSFPYFKGDNSGTFIYDLHSEMEKHGYHSIMITPYRNNSKRKEYMGDIEVFRFIYFIPHSAQLLTKDGGIHASILRNPVAVFQLPFFIFCELATSIRIIRRGRPDIIHSHWILPNSIVGTICSAYYQIPHLISVHGTDIHIAKKFRIFKFFTSIALRCADQISVNTNYIKSVVLSIEPGVTDKIRIIPMGVDFSRFNNGFTLNRLDKKPDEKIILFVGRLIEWKGAAFLIEAMKSVIQIFPLARLVIVGNGPEKPHLEDIVTHENLENNVTFYKFLSDEELKNLYLKADVFVLPSINHKGYTEGQGVVLIEAMASGIPVVASNIGGIPDIVQNGINGFLVTPRSPSEISRQVLILLTNKELSDSISIKGMKIKNLFSIECIGKQFSDIYGTLIS